MKIKEQSVKLTNKSTLFLILFVASVLRFYNYFEIPFTHDEFSALFRLQFDSFSELIEKGVKIDGHPAGVQVFEYYYTKLFGSEEWVVKLPFTLCGIASVYLIFLIGKKWFNETVGLLTSAFLASIQFTVMYSQIARPYISGLLFTLLMVYFWSNLMLNPKKRFYKNGAFFIISASLCSYNHHFSLLFAAMVGISGVFFIERKFLLKYAVFGLLIFALYIPHLNIFFYQLNVGGIEGWLGKPQDDFLPEFIYYLFNYSPIAIVITLTISALGLFTIKKNGVRWKFILLSLVWFLLPFLIGFYYSRYDNAVIQFSVLIFSFPYFFFLLFGHLKAHSVKTNLLLVGTILITNILTLIFTRDHYNVFYKSVYKEILTDSSKLQETNKNVLYIIDSNQKFTNYYTSRLNIKTEFIDFSESIKDTKGLISLLEKESKNYDKLFFGCLRKIPPQIVPLIQDYYPTVEIQNNYFGGTVYLFSKEQNTSEKLISNLDFETNEKANWSEMNPANYIALSDNNTGYKFNSNNEWGPIFSMPLEDIIENKNNFIDVSVKARRLGGYEDLVLVSTLQSDGENIYWGGMDFSEFNWDGNALGNGINVHHSIKLSDIHLKYDNIILKVYIWNKGKKDFEIDDIKIVLRRGNPVMYGWFERI